jgi:hypothetical protein
MTRFGSCRPYSIWHLRNERAVSYLLIPTLLSCLVWQQAAGSTRLYYLGNLPGARTDATVPFAINDSGVVVGSGFATQPLSYTPILFDVLTGGQNTDLNPLGGYAVARGISNSNQIVGYEDMGPNPGAMLFDISGAGNNIQLGAGKTAYAINNSNKVVGGGGNGPAANAWLWDLSVGTTPVFLGSGEATAISDNGLIVGSANPPAVNGRHATLFDATGALNNTDLGTLFAGDQQSFANGVNNSGHVVGFSGGSPQGLTATLFDKTGSGQNTALGAIGDSQAEAINNAGQIVGQEHGHATLFDPTGNKNNIDLNSFVNPASGWVLQNATAINNLGWIVGTGNFGAFLLAPDDAFPNYNEQPLGPPEPTTPEPATWLLAMIGGSMFVGIKLVTKIESVFVNPTNFSPLK